MNPNLLNNQKNKITASIFLSSFSSIASLLISLISIPILTRYAGPVVFGQIIFAATLSEFFFNFSSLGLKAEFFTRLTKNNDIENIKKISVNVFLMQAIAAATLFTVCCLASLFLNLDNSTWLIYITSFPVILAAIFYVPYYLLELDNRLYVISSSKLVANIVGLGLLSLAILNKFPFYLISSFRSTIPFTSFFSTIFRIKKNINKISTIKLSGYFNLTLINELFFESFPNLFRNTFQFLTGSINIFLLQLLSSSAELGIFSASYRISIAYYFLFASVTNGLRPTIFKLFHSDKEKFSKIFKKATLLIQLIAISVTLTLFILVKHFNLMVFLLGPKFVGSENVALVLILAGVFVSFQNIGLVWINTHRYYNFALVRSLTQVLVNILIGFVLIPKYSALGAAFSLIFSRFWASHLFLLFWAKTRKLLYIYFKSFSPSVFLSLFEDVKSRLLPR